MPKMKCKCGQQIELSTIPNKHTYLFINEVDFDNFSNIVDTEKLYMSMRESVLCPNCKRLWIFDFGDNKPIEYLRIENWTISKKNREETVLLSYFYKKMRFFSRDIYGKTISAQNNRYS